MNLIEVQADTLLAKTQANPQRPLESDKFHAVFAENRAQTAGAGLQGACKGLQRLLGVFILTRFSRRGRIYGRCEVAPRADSHRSGYNRIGGFFAGHCAGFRVPVGALRWPRRQILWYDIGMKRIHGLPEPVLVDLPGWRKVEPRIPDTAQRRQLARQRSIREIVFGVQDGILTTLGIVTGVGVAEGERSAVIITGLLALLAGALSMGVGQYLGGKSEREVVQATIEMEKAEMEEHPQDEFAEQVAYYKLKGFSAEEAHMIVSRLVQNPDIYLHEMIRDEFGIDPRVAQDRSLRPAFAMALSYAAGSVIPIVPYLFTASHNAAAIAGLVLAVLGLFAIGAFAARLSGRNPILKGLEIVLFGAAVFAISYLVGRYVPPLFGHPPVTVSG